MKLKYEFPVEVTSDTGWKYSSWANPRRGLHDYERRIEFERDLTTGEVDFLQVFIRNFDNPGYCNWSFKASGNVVILTSTLDSSD